MALLPSSEAQTAKPLAQKNEVQYGYIVQAWKKNGNNWQKISFHTVKQHRSKADTIAIDVDYVQMLTGSKARAAAIKNGDADTSFDANGKIIDINVPNDYYILNSNKRLVKIVIAPHVSLSLLHQEGDEVPMSDRLFKVYFKNKKIKKIEEVYLP